MTGVARFTIQAQLILLGDAFDARFADRILQTLELDPALAPQRWGEEPGIRDPYDRSDFLQAIIDRPEDAAPQLFRTQTCKYSAEWYGYERLLTNLSFRTGDLDRTEGEIFFDAISRLAAQLDTEWGQIVPVFEHAPPETRIKSSSNYSHLGYYASFGPTRLYPRTLLGTRLLHLMEHGPATLTSLGLPYRQLANDVYEVDLVTRPWAADSVALKNAQVGAQAKLLATEVFADASEQLHVKPGRRWRGFGG